MPIFDKIILLFGRRKYHKIKQEVIHHVSLGKKYLEIDNSNYVIDNKRIHVRFTIQNRFSITPPDSLSDYSLWIIGSLDCYYLIPNSVIMEINENPTTYVGKDLGYKVVNIDIKTNMCEYAIGGIKTDFSKYRNTFL